MIKSVFSSRAARLVLATLLCTPLALLTACGGGGGGGDSGGDGGSNASGVVITSANSQPVAAEAVETASSTDAAAGAGFLVGVQVNDGAARRANALLLAQAARRLLATAPAPLALATGVTAEQPLPCTSGSGTISVTTSGSGTLAAGDSFKVTANACVQGSGGESMTMNGVITMTILGGNFDPASTVYPKTLSMRIAAQGFAISAGGETEVFTGDVTLTINETSATSTQLSITANTLTSNLGGSHTLTLTNYSMQATETSSGVSITMSATVQTTNSRLGSGEYTYTMTTVTPLTVSSSGIITGGSIKVTGSGSALLVTVTGSDAFTLQVDANGDGAWDSSGESVTRTQLQALI